MLLNRGKFELADKTIKSWMKDKADYGSFGDFCLNLSIAGKEISFCNTRQSYFRLASVSKILTIILALKLESEKKLSLDDDIRKHIPIKSGRKITIRELLEHRSGISRDGVGFCFWDSAVFPGKNAILSLPSSAFKRFNGGFKYSNLGYAILGLIIEKACGITYFNCLNERIAGPLGLKIYNDDEVKLSGFSSASGNLANDPAADADTRAFYPAFGTIISADSAGRLISFICSPEKMDDFFGAGRRKYFFNSGGNELEQWNNSKRKIYGHGGDFFGASADLFIDPKNRIGGIILSNVRGAGLTSISDGLLKTIYAIEDNPSFSRGAKAIGIEGTYKSRDRILTVISLGNDILLFNPADNSPFYDGMVAKKGKGGKMTLKLASSFAEVGEEVLFSGNFLRIGALKYKRISGITGGK